jgi:hypothetical protein
MRAPIRLAVATCLAVVSGAVVFSRAPGQSPTTASGTATLTGRVMRGESSNPSPVSRVLVNISLGDGGGTRQAVTDDQGRFVFDRLPAAGFLVTASRPGWVTTYYGSPRPGRPPGIRVAVADGAKVDIEIPIVPGGVIAGRIIGEDGQPRAREFPLLLEKRLVGQQQMLSRMRLPYGTGYFERSTNDLGEFRLFGLPPGTYYLLVNPSITSGARLTTQDEVRWALQPPGAPTGAAPPQGAVAGYAPFYYPGTSDPLASQPIVIGPGEVREGLTFRVGFVPVARVEGVVSRSDGAPVTGTRIALDARVPQVNIEGSTRQVTVDAAGRFAFTNVPPGDYVISARSGPAAGQPPASAPPLLWAQTDLVVAGQDVQGVALTLAPAAVATGKLTFSSSSPAIPPPADLTTVRLQFISTGAAASALAGGGGATAPVTATVASDGAFRVAGLPPGRYLPSATWPGIRSATGGWWLTNVIVDNKDIGDTPLDVRPNEDLSNLTLAFRDRIGTIEGQLTDATGRPASAYFVVAFPFERESWTTTSRRAVPAVRPGTDGQFRVTGLLAGQYYIAVVTSVEPDEAMDPAFLDAILPGAIKVTVQDGQTVRQDIRIGR